MRTDKGWRRFYATGWLLSAGVGIGVFRMWQLHLQEVEQRAEEAERTRDEVARRRAVEERLRIARELHDSLTHSISVITVQAGVEVHLAHKRGEEIPPALLAIQEASTEASRELRATLGMLRADDDVEMGLERLPALVDRARSAGVPTTLSITGKPCNVPPAIGKAAFRIVQEALNNVGRHAGDASAVVALQYGTTALAVQVDDDGVGSAAVQDSHGLGLIGMRERVAELGGTVRAEPRSGGGFTVRAELPLQTAP
ncbi:sensor histidine kinase [Jatrophihabitans sp. DSM 45814]